MKNDKITNWVCAALIIATLTGCAKKSDCNFPTKHAHKYIKQFENGSTIETYFTSEKLTQSGFNWQEELIEITNEDKKIMDLITKKELFVGNENWQYLYNKMKDNKDYLMFYYYYTETHYVPVTKTRTNAKGELETYTEMEQKTETYSGWKTDPYYVHNTGRVKIMHMKYYSYKIVQNIDGSYELKRSPYVDDIREIIDEYPYFVQKCEHEVEYEIPKKYNKKELPYLKVSDFNHFNEPDLTNTTPELSTKIKKRILI